MILPLHVWIAFESELEIIQPDNGNHRVQKHEKLLPGVGEELLPDDYYCRLVAATRATGWMLRVSRLFFQEGL